ncbi:MAG: acetyltransferase [Saprospiraceae bacterium]|nr:MAG: acetyltransferase [Saprospiraceae bacterium]
MYLLSDFIYFWLYRVFSYRKEVVLTNLRNSFPEKSEAEIQKICRAFYSYFCDLILEVLKTLTISKASVRRHVTLGDTAVFEKHKDKSLVLVMGHFGNWELAGARYSMEPIHQLYVVYHPLRNPYFDKLLYFMRTRSGTKLYTMKETKKAMVRDRGLRTAVAFIADQTPSHTKTYWTTFLNQDTPVFSGPEKIAKNLDYPVVYISMKRIKRGQYQLDFEEIFSDPQSAGENEILELYTRRLEQDILERPETWVWTHRRWKHKREPNTTN